MFKGYYSYIKENTNIKTKYIIEFTKSQKILDMMDTKNFTFDMLNKIEFDYLQEAINAYNTLYYNESTLHVMLFEQVILDDEIILEQSKDMQASSILTQETKRQIEKITLENEALREENEKMKTFLKKYNINIDKMEV